MKTLHALLSSEAFIFSRASDEIYLIAASLAHILHNERIFPQSQKADPSCTFGNFIKPTEAIIFVFAFLLTSDDPFNKAGKC